jgi:uncharacterized protein YcbX
MPALASLHLYPIKGCAGITLAEATLGEAGLEHHGAGDREWMVVDAASGRFETQRSLPALARLVPSIDEGWLRLDAPGAPPLEVELAPSRPRALRTVTVWRHTGPALDEGDAAAAWLSARLGRALRLVRFDPAAARHAEARWTDDAQVPVRFPDGFPLLVAGHASLAQVNRWLAAAGRTALPMNRFRPNLVIEGLPPFAEDALSSLEIGVARIRPVKGCTRCGVPSIDQSTGERGPDPLDVLEDYRMDTRLGGITFGMNAIVVAGAGARLRAGDPVTVRPR